MTCRGIVPDKSPESRNDHAIMTEQQLSYEGFYIHFSCSFSGKIKANPQVGPELRCYVINMLLTGCVNNWEAVQWNEFLIVTKITVKNSVYSCFLKAIVHEGNSDG